MKNYIKTSMLFILFSFQINFNFGPTCPGMKQIDLPAMSLIHIFLDCRFVKHMLHPNQ